MRRQRLRDDRLDRGAGPARLGEDVVGVAERDQAGGEGGEPVLRGRGAAHGLVRQGVDHRERVLDAVLQLARQQRLPLLGLLGLRHVPHRADDTHRRTVALHALAAGMDDPRLAVRMSDRPQHEVEAFFRTRRHRAPDRRLDALAVVGMDARPEGVGIADGLRLGNAEDRAAARVADHVACLEVVVETADLGRLVGEAEPGLGLDQRALGLTALRIGPGPVQDLADEADLVFGPVPGRVWWR